MLWIFSFFFRYFYRVFNEERSDIMKTLKQLYEAKIISPNAYASVVRGVLYDRLGCNRRKDVVRYSDDLTIDEIRELTVKDIFELFTEEEIRRWAGIGTLTFDKLKSLV
jgi:hypothetical protein